ncbi:hypothetical protein FY034_07405 [Trichlorobacter lovleyi]|uniref:hypothetical protein n=1 Tax=Trichlorobacter lovleyi TaxID=313985 RepID=UPI00224009FD|nr:hypothetical protein [Trichlorobacter lovleyi]QOX78763.1 hypothetical protein FY034_07405 [Trichlorobacter lovleyi]
MAKKPGYTIEQHEQLGIELQAMRDRLVKIQVELSHAYPIKLASKVDPACKAVDALRCALDDQICKEHPGNKDMLRVYYRANRADYKEPESPAGDKQR